MTFPVPPASTLGDSERLALRNPDSSPSRVTALLILRMYVYDNKAKQRVTTTFASTFVPRLITLHCEVDLTSAGDGLAPL